MCVCVWMYYTKPTTVAKVISTNVAKLISTTAKAVSSTPDSSTDTFYLFTAKVWHLITTDD